MTNSAAAQQVTALQPNPMALNRLSDPGMLYVSAFEVI